MRAYAPPVRTDGLRITALSDMHIGRRAFTSDALTQVAASLDAECDRTDLFVNAGDSIHWRLAQHHLKEDRDFKAWVEERREATGKPWITIGGNHDLASYGVPYPTRTGEEWLKTLGLGTRNRWWDFQDWARVLAVTPKVQEFDSAKPGHFPMQLDTDEIEWIRERALEVPNRRVLVFFHAPIPAHYSGHMRYADFLQEMIRDTPNLIGWISGHRHTNLTTDTRAVMNLSVLGKQVHALSLPTLGGATPGYADDRWGQPYLATHITLLPEGGLEVRFRDHILSSWVPWRNKLVTRLPGVAWREKKGSDG